MSKNIVICYDGTGNEYGEHNTNVVRTFEAIVRDENQIGFYDPGVGTLSYIGRSLGRKIGTLMGKAFGYGFIQNIEDGYEYVMENFGLGGQAPRTGTSLHLPWTAETPLAACGLV
jgi:uncharacterized protein (DUF2235 family)